MKNDLLEFSKFIKKHFYLQGDWCIEQAVDEFVAEKAKSTPKLKPGGDILEKIKGFEWNFAPLPLRPSFMCAEEGIEQPVATVSQTDAGPVAHLAAPTPRVPRRANRAVGTDAAFGGGSITTARNDEPF